MKRRWLFPVLAAIALVLAFAIREVEIAQYRNGLKSVSETICDVVQLRAQGGSTRDVYDQVFSFLRKHSQDPSATVIIRAGGKEIGSSKSEHDPNRLTKKCPIENSPDYEISMQFANQTVWGTRLFVLSVALFFSVFVLALLLRSIAKWLKSIWSNQVLSEVRRQFGIGELGPQTDPYSRLASRLLSGSLTDVRENIFSLRQELAENQNKLLDSKIKLAEKELDKARADAFEYKVSMISHDLRGPLSALKMSALSTKEAQEDLFPIIQSIEKIVGDLDQQDDNTLLQGLSLKRIEIVEVIALEAVTEKRMALKSSGIQISYEYDPSALSPVLFNSRYFGRIVGNLIQNSVNAFGAEAGQVWIRVSRRAQLVRIEVADNGRGIPAELQPHVFNRGSTFGNVKGSGLGLYFVKTCVESWGGSIELESSAKGGTKISILLPISDQGVQFQGPEIILDDTPLAILDDEIELQRKFWSHITSQAKYFSSPHTFMDWIDDSDLGSNHTFIIDFDLKGPVTGLDVIRTLRPGPTIFLSTSDYLNSQVLELARSHNVVIIPKPLLASIAST